MPKITMFLVCIVSCVFILRFQQSAAKAEGLGKQSLVRFPELKNINVQFNSCHIHIVNYRFIDIDQPNFITPVSLTRFHSVRVKWRKNQYRYESKLYGNRDFGSIFYRQQRANFRWYCNLHIFLLAEPTDVLSHQQFPEGFYNFWAPIQYGPKSGNAIRMFEETRMDFCFLMTESSDIKVHANFSLNVEHGFKIHSGGYIHRAIFVLKKYRQEYQLYFEDQELRVSKLFLVCPFCIPDTFQFIQVLNPVSKLDSMESFKSNLELLLKIWHPVNSMDITDFTYFGETNVNFSIS